MKDKYTQADMDSVLMSHRREKELREIATENFEKMKAQVAGNKEKEEKLEKLRVQIIEYLERVRDAVKRPRSYDMQDALWNIEGVCDRTIKKLEEPK